MPAEGCCQNFVQGGIVIYADDGNFIKHVVSSIYETRQTEFAKRQSPVPAGYPVYGNSVGGPVEEDTYLRIVRQQSDTENLYTGYTSLDSETWDETGTWTTPLGTTTRIGLVSMASAGFTTTFDYLRVSALAADPTVPTDPPTEPPTDPTTPAVPPAPSPSSTAAPGSAGGSDDAAPGMSARKRGSLSNSGVDTTGVIVAATAAAVLLALGSGLLLVRRRNAQRAEGRRDS